MESNIPVTFCMYLGPTIRGVIQHASIYAGTVEDAAKELDMQIKKYPRIKALLIPEATLPEDRVKIKTPGNYLFEQNRLFIKELMNKSTLGGS